ncbi:MAG: GTPase ObgE, partial [Mucilaginibacter polytrichastri]|nr:GTPase ObgE [Mucilaginibacter polytrichastri]
MKADLPKDIPSVFISSVAQKGLNELKDLLWREITA